MPVPAAAQLHGSWAALAGSAVAARPPASGAPAGPGVRFGPSPSVAVSPGSRLCPPGWCGIVVIDGAVIATAPDADAAWLLRAFLIAAPPPAWTDPDAARALLPVAGTLGPATLAYLDPDAFRPAGPPPGTAPGEALGALLAAAGPADAGESGLDEAEHVVTVPDGAGGVVAAAGYARWPGGIAHLGVLTHPAARGLGHGRRAASAAVAAALAEGLRPQWRARPAASRRLAASLGFTERGAQLSLRLRPAR